MHFKPDHFKFDHYSPVSNEILKAHSKIATIMEYGSTSYVGMAWFLNGRHIKSA